MSEAPKRKVPRFGIDFSASPGPLQPPKESSRSVLVIGAGVAGLMSSWILLDHGYHVTILAKDWPSFTNFQRLTSQISGALWEMPPAPCGPRVSPQNLDKVRQWALESYQVYCELAEDTSLARRFGVQLRKNLSCFPMPIEDHEVENERLHAIRNAGLLEFRHDRNLIQEYDTSCYGAEDAFQHLSPVIDTDQAMSFLMELVKSKAATLITGTVKGDLLEREGELKEIYGVDIIVNATGLSGRELGRDPGIHAGRGGVLRVVNDGKDFPKIEHAMVVNTKDPYDYNIVFIVPRNDQVLILGTFIEMDQESYELTLGSPAMLEMREKCESFIPQLKHARLDPEYPMAQGIRPLRRGDVRVQAEERKTIGGDQPSCIVHAYGHGIGGWTLAFGSAFEVLSLVQGLERNVYNGLRV